MRLIALDLLRFAAALSVMVYHYCQNADANTLSWLQPIAAYGYLGVPGFFIISGYVISLSAANSSASGFAVSRFVRLFPTYWLAILFTVVVAAALGTEQFPLAQIAANFTMFNESMGYENIDDVYWTLHEELKFYACVFTLVLFGAFKHYKVWLSLWLLLTVAFIALGEYLSAFAFIISPYYSSFFIAGIAFYLIQQHGLTLYNTVVLGIAALVSAYHLFYLSTNFMPEGGPMSQLVSIGCVFALFGLFYLFVSGKIVLERRKIYLTLGALTYPLYLIHSVAGDAIIERLQSYTSQSAAIISCSVLMLVISYLINTQFEDRISRPLKSQLLSFFSAIGAGKPARGARS